MPNPTKAFEVPNGVFLEDGTWIGGGSAAPLGVDVPEGSRYFRDDGIAWRKNGPGVNDWQEADFSIIRKEPTGFENSTDSAISFDDATLTFSIAPAASSFKFWRHGTKFEKTSADSVVITDTEGIWFVTYNASGVLVASQTIWDIEADVLVAYVYWDATNNKAILLGDERHGIVMDGASHKYLHRTRFTQLDDKYRDFAIGNYTEQGSGDLDSDAQLSLGNGAIHDEDLFLQISNSATPTAPFEQKLSPIANIPIYYKLGANADIRKNNASAFPVIYDGANPIKYNYFNPSTEIWSLESVPNGGFMGIWIYATNSVSEPIIAIAGVTASLDVTSVLTEKESEIIEGIPYQEYRLLYRVIFQSNTSYTNTPLARLYAVNDLRYLAETQDRYLWECGYNANAGVGRYMQRLGLDMDEAPFVMPENGFIKTIILLTTAINTGSIGFFKSTDLVNPVITISLSASSFVRADVPFFFQKNELVLVRVISGSFSKPQLACYNQTNIEEEF